MDNPEVTFIPDRNHHDSEQQQRSGTPINLMDIDVVDEVACNPSFHPSNVSTPSFSAEQRMQNKFDAVSRQIDMFNHFWTYTSNLTTVVNSVLKFMISGTTSILKS